MVSKEDSTNALSPVTLPIYKLEELITSNIPDNRTVFISETKPCA